MSLTEAASLAVADERQRLTLELLVLEADSWPLDEVAAVAWRNSGGPPPTGSAEPVPAAPAAWGGPLDDFWLREPTVEMLDRDLAALS